MRERRSYSASAADQPDNGRHVGRRDGTDSERSDRIEVIRSSLECLLQRRERRSVSIHGRSDHEGQDRHELQRDTGGNGLQHHRDGMCGRMGRDATVP